MSQTARKLEDMVGPEDVLERPLLDRVTDALRTVYDPEIPVDIYELGLVYDIDIDAACAVTIRMTLTSPGCPVAGILPGEVEAKVRDVDGVSDVAVDLVWDPPWTPDRMSEAARLELGFF
jgi:FeS assembly SUF system protein